MVYRFVREPLLKIQLIRNATLRLTYAGHVILIDPLLGPKHSYQSLAGKEDNPTVDLPMPLEQVLADVELVIVSHLHNDHFDATAKTDLPRGWPILCQPGDQARLAEHGFSAVTEIENEFTWQGIRIIRTGGTHGSGPWGERLNPVSGFVFCAESEPTLYWLGDTILYDEVSAWIDQFEPDVIVTHSGGAELQDSGPIVMDIPQTLQTAAIAPAAVVLPVHLEALDHCLVMRLDLRAAIEEVGESERVLVLDDGEAVEIE
jgi:L-ascorbate metabolism protein UlaG (beta-lactamase superfamily)